MAKRAPSEELRELAASWRDLLTEASSPAERDGIRARIVRPFLEALRGAYDPHARRELLDGLLALHAIESLGRELLEALAEIADERADPSMQRPVLEALLGEVDAAEKPKLVERIGDVLAEAGDRAGAVERWKSIARERLGQRDAGGRAEARRLFERVLDAAPNDVDAAAELVRLHLDDGAWQRIPEVVSAMLRADADRAGELLLSLESRARDAGDAAVDAYGAMIDEAVALGRASSDLTRRLRRARARALAAQPDRHDEASASWRLLLDAFESPEDAREYEAFIASRTDESARHEDRRWLFAWNVARARGAGEAAAALRDWAKTEIDRGETVAAIDVHRQWLEAAAEKDRAAIRLALAGLLLQSDRAADAASAIAPLLSASPVPADARDLAHRLLEDVDARPAVVERIESIAGTVDDTSAARLLDFLLATRVHTASMPEARRRWYRRATGIAAAAPPAASAIADALAHPDDVLVWETAENAARASGELDTVARAYADVLAREDLEASLAETLGRRFLALEPECAIEAGALVASLEHILARVPCARFALDRVKVALGDLGSWDPLFAIWDRAIEAAPTEAERDALLDEATFLARDLASDAARATQYLAKIHGRRPDDAAVTSALERLYERQGNKPALVALLRERGRTTPRIVGLLLDLGRIEDARSALHALADARDDVVDLMERFLRDTNDDTVVIRLRDHYVRANRVEDAVRVVRAALARTSDATRRVRWLRGLVRLGVDGNDDAGGDARLRRVACRTKLLVALDAWRRARGNAEHATRARTAIDDAQAFALDNGDARAAARLLERGARLPFDTSTKRAMLHEAAVLHADRLGDAKKAMRIFADLFREDAADSVADAAFDRYAALLATAGEHAKVAKLWETRALERHDADAWVRAGRIWETEEGDEDPRRALDAYRRAADLGSTAGHEGLARLHLATWRWEEAISALEWLLERSAEQHATRIVQLADALCETGRSKDARARLREALAKATDPASSQTIRARLVALYRREDSWSDLASALVDHAESAAGRERVALLGEAASVQLSKLDDRAEAARLCTLAIAADPKDASLRPRLADLLEHANEWERVATVLREQVELEADRAPREAAALRQRLARALLRVDRTTDALEQLRAAARLLPTDARILLELGKLAVRTGDLDGAERAYRSLLLAQRSAPAHVLVPRLTIYVELARIAARRDDSPRAVTLIESALDAVTDAKGRDIAARAEEARDLAEAWRTCASKDEELRERIRAHAASVVADLEEGASGAWSLVWSAYAALGDEEMLLQIVRRHVEAMRRGALDRAMWRGWILDAASLSARLGDVDLSVRLHAELITVMDAGADRARLRVELASLLEACGDASDEVMTQLTLAAADDPLNEEAVARLATRLERDGGFAEHAALLSKRLEALAWGDPRFIETAWRLGRALESAEQWPEAARLYESILDRAPTDAATARTLAHRLEALESPRLADALELWMQLDASAGRAVAPRIVELREASGDHDAVERALEAALRGDPAEPTFLERLVRMKEDAGDRAAAATLLRRALDATPNDRALLRRLLSMQRANGGEEANLALLDALVAAHGEEAELLCLRAAVKEALGDGDGAIEDLRRMGLPERVLVNERIGTIRRVVASKTPPAADDLAMMLVDDLVFAAQHAEADAELHAVLARSPEHAGALERFGALYVARREWARAQHTYAKLLSIVERKTNGGDDREPLARVVIAFADACTRAGQPGDARQALERVWRIAPERHEIGECLERVCEVTKDRKRLAELVAGRAQRAETAGAKVGLLLEAAELLAREGDDAGALRTIEAARAVDPANIEAALAAGEQLLAQRRALEAIFVLSDVVERNPRKRVAAMALVNLTLAKAHLAVDELAEALDALKAAFAIDVRSGELAMLLGQVALDLGEVKVAERAFVAVTFASGVSTSMKASALYHLATIARGKGDLVTARRFAGKATIEDPSHHKARGLLERLEEAGVRTPRAPAVT